MTTTILVNGSTGTIGSQLTALLAGREGVEVRAASRGGSAKVQAPNVKGVRFDYDDVDSQRAALDGADKLFLVTPFAPNQVEVGVRLVELAKTAGVKHIVKLSAIGCDIEPGIQLGRWHRAVEKAVESSGIPYTLLRPNNFFENFLHFYPPQKDGRIYLPWGQAACSFIAGGDIAAVAAVALTEAEHTGRAYELTGPEAITVAHAAHAIGEVSGRKVEYIDVPEETARKAMLDSGAPEWMTSAMMELHAIDKAGYAASVNDNVEKLTHRPATRFVDFARKNASHWKQ